MQQSFFSDSDSEHFTDEQAFRLKLPDLAAMIDSQLPRRALTPENCTFDYAHKGRLRNSLGQVCKFQAMYRLKDSPGSVALVELVEVFSKGGNPPTEKTTFRYERDFAGA